jgi:hypothetical protein
VDALRPGSRGGAPARAARDLTIGVAVLLLAAFFATQYVGAWSVPFINDDYVFLDKTRNASFLSLWKLEALAFHWYRPWSRELHYWTLQRLFGARELPFHLASWALALAILGGAYALFRRFTGSAAAAIAIAGIASLAAWGVPLVWIAGVQDLWMLAFAVLFLHAVARGARGWAAAALVLALLSKEAAAVLPALAVAHRRLIERRPLRDALAWSAPLAGIVAFWALVHPVLGGRLWRPFQDPLEPGLHSTVASLAWRTVAVPLNVDAVAAPEHAWGAASLRALPGVLALGAMIVLARRRAPPRAAPPPGRVAGFGLAWAALGWIPLLLPTLGWHAYYALLGAFGAWLAIGTWLARRTTVAVALVSALAVLRAARADTPSRDWGSEWYQRRAGSFIALMRADLRRLEPRPAPHTRFFFVRVPSNVGFLAGDAPALRVWYGDSTLRGGYYPAFRAREPGAPGGPDRFFRFDSTTGWVPVIEGREDVAAARRANPRWMVDHENLARTLAEGGEWAGAATEFEKLAAADSSSVEFAYNAAVCHETLGDSTRAAIWYERAASLPGADEEVRASARRLARHLPGR